MATQKLGLVHETPEREPVFGLRFGLGVIDQAVPLNVTIPVGPPVATQKLGLVHETAERELPAGKTFGLGVTDQLVPLNVSIRVSVGKELLIPPEPTATQKLGLVHETPVKLVDVNTEVVGLGVTDHELPLKVSISA